ncbi:trichohyalin-like isoform X5 [Ostrea edulis]|uniref:trichohyalin-like isoform X5 n=1 Tax=Ostrea edulis TaxID=37623 RepID=UPI0024AEB6E4|nr:trichohyalin-like isoform X5 [Ostrea edulis]
MSTQRSVVQKPKHVKMNGISVSGSGDWSDDAVKSGSNTGFSDPENDPGTARNGNKNFPKKYDPVNAVLDKIDSELSSMKSYNGSQRSSKGDKPQSSKYDELMGSQQEKSETPERYRKVLEPPSSGLDISRSPHIVGTAEIYSDAAGGTDVIWWHPKHTGEEKMNAPSDLDSLSAQQLDEKFKEIMRKKRGNYLDHLRASYPQSDTDTINTEDYEKKFRSIMVYNSDDSSTLVLSDDDRLDDSFDESLPPPLSYVVDPPPNTGSRLSDVTEEPGSVTTPKLNLQTKTLAALSPAVPVVSQTDRSTRSRRRRTPYTSEAESIKTEDFEIRFQDLMVQPQTQQNGRDTGQESEPVDPLHKKVREILRVSAPYDIPLYRNLNKTKSRNGYHRNKAYENSESEERPVSKKAERPNARMNTEELAQESARIQKEMDERKTRGNPSRRDEKSPTRTAMNLSFSAINKSPSYEDLRSQLPPGCPTPLTGRFSPSPQERASPSSSPSPPKQKSQIGRPMELEAQPSSPRDLERRTTSAMDRPRKYSDVQNPNTSTRHYSPDRTADIQMDSPTMTSSPRERKSQMPDRGEQACVENSREQERSQQLVRPKSRKPIDRYDDQDSDFSDAIDNSLYERSPTSHTFNPITSSPIERGRTRSRRSDACESPGQPMSRSLSERPFYSRSPYNHERSQTSPERPGVSHEPQNVSLGRISPILNGRGSPRNTEEKLSVSFQDYPPPVQEAGRASPTYLDLAYNKERPSFRSEWISKGLPSKSENEKEPKTLKRTLVDLRTAEKQLKEIKALTEDARTQLMLTEFKRDNKQRDYERMSEDLNRRKRELKGYEDQLRSRTSDILQIDQSHLDDRTLALIQENESLKHRLRQADGLELERDELVRQLEMAKEDLFNEQKQARHKVEELKDELENLSSQLEENRSPYPTVDSQKVRELEEALSKLENDKTNLIRDKASLYEELQEMSKSSKAEYRPRSGKAEELRTQIDKVCLELADVKEKNSKTEEINGRLREQIGELKRQLEREKTLKDGLLDDHKRTLQTLRKEMDTAMVQMRENLFLEKQKAIENIRGDLDKGRSKTEERLQRATAEHQKILKQKEEEIIQLIDVVGKLEKDRSLLERRIKDNTEQKVQEALKQERAKLEKDKEFMLMREKEQKESRQTLNNLANELEQERQHKGTLIERISQLNGDLEDQRQMNKQAAHDRMMAVARAKDQLKHEMLQEMDRAREKLKQEHKQEIERLQDTIRRQEEELCNLRAERKLYVRPELENSLDRVERTIVNEINDECRRNSGILGNSPRKVNLKNFQVENGGYTPNGRSRTPTTAALANLRACNQDLRNHVTELRRELELQKTALLRVEKEKDDLVQRVKKEIEVERSKELEKVKQSLMKQVPAPQYNGYNVHKPNNQIQYNNKLVSTPHYEYSPRDEVQNYEIERLEREIRRLAENQKQMIHQNASAVENDIQNEKMINQLKARVMQLQDENIALKSSKFNSFSVPDLSNPAHYRSTTYLHQPTHREKLAHYLEHRSKEGVIDSETVADHQRLNRNMISKKMGEVTRLQNSLTDQAKDLIYLGRSYNHLDRYYHPREAWYSVHDNNHY